VESFIILSPVGCPISPSDTYLCGLADFNIRQEQGDQKIRKNSQKSHQVKKGQNIYNKAQFQSPYNKSLLKP